MKTGGQQPSDRLKRKTGTWPKLVEKPPVITPDRAEGENTGIIRGRIEILRELVFAVENATEAIALLDEQGRFKYLNQAYCRLHGCAAQETLKGKSWRIFHSPEEGDRIENEISLALVHEAMWQGQTQVLGREGRSFPASMTMSVLPNGDLLCQLRDMSSLELAQKERAGLFEIIANPILVLDENGIIAEANDAWRQLLGYSAEETLGAGFSGFAHAEDAVLLEDRLREALSSGGGGPFTCRQAGKSGRVLFFEWTLFKLGPQRLLAYGHHTTALIEAQAMVVDAAAAQMHAANQRNHFFSMASHELGTPISAIGLGLSLLSRHMPASEGFEFRDTIQKLRGYIERQASVYEKIFIIGETLSGKMRPEPRPCSLFQLAETSLYEAGGKYGRQNDLRFKTNSMVGPADCWNMDRELVRQILANVLSNACKYSDPGTQILLEINGKHQGVEIMVKDKGIGVPAPDLERVTEGFYRGQNVGGIPGSGLGLLLVKQCVEVQAGRLQIISREGLGTTVIIEIPAPWVEVVSGDWPAGRGKLEPVA